MEKTEDSKQFAKHGEDMFNKRMLEDIEESESVTKRLSIVVNEIEEFEREFIYPMNKSVSSSNISEASRPRRTKRSTPKVSNKYYSTTTLGSSKLGSIFHSSTDSVYSEYDSGAYSRDSTPDFSLISSITNVSKPLISPSLVLSYNIKSNKRPYNLSSGEKLANPLKSDIFYKSTQSCSRPVTFTEVVFANNCQRKCEISMKDCHRDSQTVENENLFSSIPELNKKHVLSKSQSFLRIKTPTVLKRSTTSVGFTCSRPTRTVRNSVDCDTEVTVNGLCYQY